MSSESGFKAWALFWAPIDGDKVDDAQIREIRFLRLIGLVLAITYPTWFWVNQAAVADFHESFLLRAAIGLLGLLAAVLTRFSRILEKNIRAIFYAIAILIAAHMSFLVHDNGFHLSYTTDALTTCMLVEFCMPALFGAIGFPLFVIGVSAVAAYAAGDSQGWFFLSLMAETMGVAFFIVFIRLRNLREIDQANIAYKQAKAVAEAANEAKTRFLAVMSHEIRTPMNSVLGLTELMEQEGVADDQKASLRDIHASAEHLLRLVNDLLDLSRIESGNVELETLPYSLHENMRKTLALLSPQGMAKGIHLRYVTRNLPDPLWIVGDPFRLQQVLYNLIANALKFTEQGWVTLMVDGSMLSDQKARIRFAVRDTGIGIPADRLETIFNSFVQAESSTTRRYGGSGLGLAISRQLVELMGGELAVSSREGSGSEFYFEIAMPLAEKPEMDSSQSGPIVVDVQKESLEAAEPGKGQRVLIIDDNPVNLKVAKAMLQRLGCQIETADDGRLGVEAWQEKGPFDLIFMDCLMPNLDGYQATKIIRDQENALPGNVRVPIIALTANAMQGEKERCKSAGMDDYLSKPVQISQMRKTLNRWVKNRPSIDENPASDGVLGLG